jgi:2-oxoglutarate/2-oxoacid ferredoxin oxidoreductase subunit alpha
MVDFTWKIAGPAGFGIMSSGLIFSKAFLRAGYHVFDYAEFPSLIRGGHNTHQSRISSLPLHAQARPVHILVSLNREGFSKHANELALGAAVIYDNERIKDAPGKGTPCPVPLAKLAREAGGTDLMANNVAIGASFALLDADMDGLNSVIHDIFGRKGGAVVAANVKAARAGYDYVKKEWKGNFSIKAPKQNSARRMLITGNEALGAGAIAAGCKLYVGYPMTPTSSLLTYMATHAEQFGFVVRQAEDEISVINNAIGAAFAGVRAMVGTAGGGFALMSEGYGLAAMTETPVVIVVGQRPGPATGLPTWTGQADLRFPRIVIAPGDVEEAFYCAAHAHNIAEKLQTPVILLTDKYLAENHWTVDGLDRGIAIERGELIAEPQQDYKRYKITETGVSPRALPGTPGTIVVANSDEHQESGISTEEADERNAMMEKRMRKLALLEKDWPAPKLYGEREAELMMVGFGTVKGPVLEALKELQKEKIVVSFLHFVYLAPFPAAAAAKQLKQAKQLLCVENNFTGQFAGYVQEKTGIALKHALHKYDGRPFYPEEIIDKVKEVLQK